ncbi:putative Peptidase M22 [Nitrospira sp. KM1]|uniref:tRNA (adenosine(37)-N6)-threonylcarbamoyltransferase complex dimerization subunit type 1 TsaB n=1 Tax=Nitrospira sp. KM1 TaxID=1936990 RepID=UPI0013A77DE6|nr:tRNA (adenosine(37)-N6)-threonylcarbamoyltransferase complex dimerization subunit type 1 TsaB [Nitrospira sp. KM1]BCA53454.1 putative Peptidase M22 [Nitrospira sp. KM1]
MKVLAVDTATAWQSVAILDGDHVLGRHDQQAAGAHVKLLLPTIDKLLAVTGLSLERLDGLVASIGPGSFTGLRVGLATILGFRSVTQTPFAVVPTLEAMAWNLRGSTRLLCPVLNSRRGELYWAVFQWTKDGLRHVVAEQVGSPEMLGRALSMDSVVLYGEGWSTEAKAIRSAAPKMLHIEEAADEVQRPSAVSVALAGMARLAANDTAGIGVSPFYVQRPEAEIRFEQSGGASPVARRREKISRKLEARSAARSKRKLHK